MKHKFVQIFFWTLILLVTSAAARDFGQWKDINPLIADWFRDLKQPDYPQSSCCGDADAYYADEVESDLNGGIVAVITDARDDIPLRRAHIPPGTRIAVPSWKIRKPAIFNPTGHAVIFLRQIYTPPRPYPQFTVYCYEPLPLF